MTLNIASNCSVVKQNTLYKAQIIKEYLLLQPTMKKFSSERVCSQGGSFHSDFVKFFSEPDQNCPLSVPTEFKSHKQRPVVFRGKRKPPKEKYPDIYSQAVSGYVSDSVLISTYEKRLKERPLILWAPPGQEASVFWGKVKGSDLYNAYITDRINNHSKALVENYNFFYFLTFTYAYKIYGENIVEAWQTFNHQLSLTLRALRKKYKMGYVCVLESTKKGYPHAHIILGVNKSVDKWHEKLSDGRRITCGRLFNFVKSSVASPVFSIQKAGGTGLVKYLGKYISKGAERALSESVKNNGRLSTPTRKALLSCLMPVLAGVRQYRFSIRDNIVPGINWVSYSDEDLSVLQELVNLGTTSPEGDRILIRLLNKLTSSCQASAWVIFNSKVKKDLSSFVGWYSRPPPELVKDFHNCGNPLGCPGCIVTSFLFNYQYPSLSPLPMPGAAYASIYYNQRKTQNNQKRRGSFPGIKKSNHGEEFSHLLPATRGSRAKKERRSGAWIGAGGQEKEKKTDREVQKQAGNYSDSGLAAFSRWTESR